MSESAAAKLPSFFGQKVGMTRVFDKEGNSVPVTVIKLIPNVISQVKTKTRDGYNAYQVAYYEKRESLVSKPIKGHLKKASISKTLTKFAEFKSNDVNEGLLGQELGYSEFTPETFVDVTGLTKGHGFQGVMKKYNFQGGPAAHGSCFHRRPGSIGNRATPARVFPEKKMPGRMGNEVSTVQNLRVYEVNLEDGFMLIKGSVPGAKNSFVKITKAIKKGL